MLLRSLDWLIAERSADAELRLFDLGTHAELVALGGDYATSWIAQMRKIKAREISHV